jgi:hypothetical protein
LDDTIPSREECWSSLPPRLRTRLAEITGEVIEWFATRHAASGDGRSRCVVLGYQALCIAEPRINPAGRPVYAVHRYELDQSSYRAVPVSYRPQGAVAAAPSGTIRGKGLPRTVGDLGLTATEQGQLGNLPPTAQQLLQAPFAGGDPIRRCEYWYMGDSTHLDPYIFILAGRRFVTAATGTQDVPIGRTPANAHWTLLCHRLAVTRVVGR